MKLLSSYIWFSKGCTTLFTVYNKVCDVPFIHDTTKSHDITMKLTSELPNAHKQQSLRLHAKALAGFLTGSEMEHSECY